MNTRTEQQAKE